MSLTDLGTPPAVFDVVPITLVFEKAGTVEIEAKISNQLLGNRIRK